MEIYNPHNMPISQFASGFNRHLVGILGGKKVISEILNYQPDGAKYFEMNTGRYAVNVGLMDSQGFCMVRFISNGIVQNERVLYPTVVKLSDLDYGMKADSHKNSSYGRERRTPYRNSTGLLWSKH
ncbi:hypothetical protein [Acinetobacter sp. ANC 3813]|uniref:hypothetical protein n=1 Tax=Acinetobacter sp. ANC 3813 TaxID=1977873 RepID=UPI00111C7EB4|nr:hypothetical protein [Acinetobacter sp. ANC 3813]